MPKSVLLELAENTALASKWQDDVDTQFGVQIYYNRFKNPNELFLAIKNSDNSYLKRKLIDLKILEPSEEREKWTFPVIKNKKRYTIYCKPVGDVLITFSDTAQLIEDFNELLHYTSGITSSLMSYKHMFYLIKKYAAYGGIKATARAPHYRLPKRTPLTISQRKLIPKEYFEDIKFTIVMWAPRDIYNKPDLIFNQFKISKEYLSRIDRVELGAEFTNPGKSRMSIDRTSLIRHVSNVPEATDKVFGSVYDLSKQRIDLYSSVLPRYLIRKDSSGDILNITTEKKSKALSFEVSNGKGIPLLTKDLIKLQNMLTVGDRTNLIGEIINSTEDSFEISCVNKKFLDEATVLAKLVNEKIKLSIHPGMVPGPFVFDELYNISNRFAWYATDPEVKNG